jgi:hypothetical protein
MAMEIVFDQLLSTVEPEIHVCMPVHNQESVIGNNLRALLVSMVKPFDLVVVIDSCEDKSKEKVLEALGRFSGESNCSRAVVIESKSSLYETLADYQGFALARAPYLLEVQADMEIREHGFDARILDALHMFPDLFAISGRGTEPFEGILQEYAGNGKKSALSRSSKPLAHLLLSIPIYRVAARLLSKLRNLVVKNPNPSQLRVAEVQHIVFPNSKQFIESGGRAGRLGHLIEHVISGPDARVAQKRIWLGQTVMRGPLILRTEVYEKLGGLDTRRFFLGFDEHELFANAWLSLGMRVGFMPIDFISPIAAGSTRRKRRFLKDFDVFRHLWRTRSGHSETALASLAKNLARLPNPEIRDF